MSLKIDKERSNIYEDDDIFGNWKVQPDEELTKRMVKQIQDSINNELMKQYLDSTTYIDSHPKNITFDSYNHPMYIPELTIKLNKSEQIVF